MNETTSKFDETSKKQKSVKVENPDVMFLDWAFAIEKHHWGIFGLTKREFTKDKKKYMAWAIDKPETTTVFPGYIFYRKEYPTQYAQVAACWVDDSTAQEVVEVHHGCTASQQRGAVLVTTAALRQWLKTGETPPTIRMIDRANSKAGLMAWRLPE